MTACYDLVPRMGPRVKLVSLLTGAVALSVSLIGFIATVTGIVLVVFGLVSLLIYHQEHVLYIPVVMGYRTVDDNPEGYRSPTEWGVEHDDFRVETKDGESIHCWRIRGINSTATIIFCHENAGNIGLRVNNLVAMSRHLSVDVVAFDYRGYGSSSGKPSEAGLLLDTEAVYNYVVKSFQPKNIYIYGRSLGGAVALQFASNSVEKPNLRGVIAENTFTSISAMVGSIFPPLDIWIVKKYFLRLRWETDKVVGNIPVPMLLISGLRDEIVPASQMADLHRICKQCERSVELAEFPEGKHNDTWVLGGQEYWNKQRSFLAKNIGGNYL